MTEESEFTVLGTYTSLAAATKEHAHNHAQSDGPVKCSACAGESLRELPDEEMLYDLADLFKVFSDTTRIKILYALMDADLCVADLTEAVGSTQSAVSHQLRILKTARLVKAQRSGKNVIYSLLDDHVYTVLAQGMDHLCE